MLYILIENRSKMGTSLKSYIKKLSLDCKLIKSNNILTDTLEVAQIVSKEPQKDRAIIIDEDGIGPFMVAAKVPHIICAMLNDEQSAYMTRDHNNANIITMGEKIIGEDVMFGIIRRFVTHDYAGGRHQVRVDMLDSMIGDVDHND